MFHVNKSIHRLLSCGLNGMNKAVNTALEGFICPACLVDFPSASKLQDHWLKFHSPKVTASGTDRVSDDYESIPDDSSPDFAPQV